MSKSLDNNITAIPDDFRPPNHALDARKLQCSRRPASGEVIEFLDIAEIQTGPFFQVSDPDLSGRYVESFLEARQVLDIFLPEHEPSG